MDRLKLMQTFVRVARTGSMTRTAEQLNLSRALISTHLNQLEAHLGTQLFNRTTRQLSLTPVGVEYLSFCSRILSEIEDVEASVAQRQSQPLGPIKIAAPLIFGHFVLAPIVADFIRRNADITATVFLYDSRMTPLVMIEDGYDVVIQLGPVADMSIAALAVGSLRYAVCAAPSYVERHGSPAEPDDLTEHNCLVHRTRNPDSIWRLLRDERESDTRVSGSLVANSDSVLLAGVRRGLGIAVLPAYCVADDIRSGAVVEVLPGYEVPRREISALLLQKRHLQRRTRMLLDYLSAHLRRL